MYATGIWMNFLPESHPVIHLFVPTTMCACQMRPRTIRTVQMAMSVPWRSRSSRFRTFVPPPAPLVPLYVREMCSLAVWKIPFSRSPIVWETWGVFFFVGCWWMFDMFGEWWILHAKTGGMLQIEKGKVRFGSWNEKYVWDDENKKVNRAVKSPSLLLGPVFNGWNPT